MTTTNYMCHEKMEEEDSPVLKIVLMLRYNDLKTTSESAMKD